jgi:hypothetical protein
MTTLEPLRGNVRRRPAWPAGTEMIPVSALKADRIGGVYCV